MPLGIFLGPAVTLVICYAGASAVLLFAAEEEEHTAGYLRQLPVSTLTLISAKLLWLSSGTLVFIVCALGIAIGAIQLARAVETMRIEAVEVVAFIEGIAAAWVWGLFWSLSLRRVMPALLAAAVSALVLIGITSNMSDGYEHFWHLGGLVVVLLLTIWPARCWQQGRALVQWERWTEPVGPPTSVAEAASSQHYPTFQWLARSLSTNLRSPLKLCQRLVALLPTLTLSKLLRRSATRDTAFQRMFSMLVWRELRTALPHALTWGLLGLLCLLLSCFFPQFPWIWFFLFGCILSCGLKTYRADHQDDTGLFLAQRGVSPGWIWCVKTGVWVSTMFFLVGGVMLLDFMAEPLRSRLSPQYERNLIVQSVGRTWQTMNPTTYQGQFTWPPRCYPGLTSAEDAGLRWSLLLTSMLGLFGIAQVASYWCRSPLMAWGGALVAAAGTFIWLQIVIYADVPHRWTLWPIVAACFLATWFTRKSWYEQRRSWGLRLRQLAWCVLPVLFVCGTAWTARATAVPRLGWVRLISQLDPQVRGPGPNFTPAFAIAVQSADLQRTPPAAWSNAWEKFQDSALVDDPERSVQLLEEIDRIDRELGCTKQPDQITFGHNLPLKLRLPGVLGFDRTILVHLLRAGEQRLAAGDTQGAVNAYLLCVRLERYLAMQSVDWGVWQIRLHSEAEALMAIERWSAHPDVTAEQLLQVQLELHSICGTHGPISGLMIYSRYVLWDEYYQMRGPLWDYFNGDAELRQAVGQQYTSIVRNLSWAERERRRRLLAYLTVTATEIPLTPHVSVVPEKLELAAQLRRWISTTPGMFPQRDPAIDYLEGQMSVEMRAYVETLALERAVQVVCRLQAQRRIEGKFPESLISLVAELPIATRDPWSGTYFGYAPNGFPQTARLDDTLFAPAGQPVLWSVGQFAGIQGYPSLEEPYQPKTFQLQPDPNRIYIVLIASQNRSISPHSTQEISSEPAPAAMSGGLPGLDVPAEASATALPTETQPTETVPVETQPTETQPNETQPDEPISSPPAAM